MVDLKTKKKADRPAAGFPPSACWQQHADL